MRPPILIDLYCGAGGAGAGYRQAGFYVIGVDREPQPRYAGDRFIQADVLEFLRRMLAGGTWDWIGPGAVAAWHASPPCQRFSAITGAGRDDHPDLIKPTRVMLQLLEQDWRTPYVIENVPRSPLLDPVTLCGQQFGLAIPAGELRRHRLFECSFDYQPPPKCRHPRGRKTIGIYGGGTRQVPRQDGGGGDTHKASKVEAQALMQIDWMTREEMCQAIPPAFTRHVGAQLRHAIR